ncbi:hypothetical protein PN462_13885 [Spirulina sp. CS-785/01]|uniref:NACHT C-terminal alpha/beta 1 domain-containing protein n=1 Tax=Spirulina sp. CS-785/01 TaxID=3021716 RepID=UPI00232C215E|nr:hypothetical protein [Spirulina sp. CS-785/01]MDB9314198.1 hypothetical protein [Spirulina sp. CS-785/01]
MTNSNPTSADALIAALHEPGREHLLDLVRNPLRLTLLCMTWDGSSLPETQAELYDRYLRKIYGWNQNWHELEDYAQRCGTTTTKLKQNLNQQLGELAKAALNLPQERFRLSQALVEKYLGEERDKTSLGYLALRLGWLNRVGRDGRGDSIFAFYHATFQEYFAALAVKDWDYFLPKDHVDCPVAGKRYRIFEKQWKQVILLWLGQGGIIDEEKEVFMEKLVNFEDGCGQWNLEEVDKGFYEYKTCFLGATVVTEFKDYLSKDMIEKIAQYSFGYLNDPKQDRQKYLSPIFCTARNVLLGDMSKKHTIPVLEEMLNSSDIDVRFKWLLADALREFSPSNQQVIPFSEKLLSSSDSHTLESLILEEIQSVNPQNIPTLLSQLTDPTFETWREVTMSLMQVAIENEQLSLALEKLMSDPKIASNVLDILDSVYQVMHNSSNEEKYNDNVYTNNLEKLTLENNQEYMELVNVLKNSEDEWTTREAAESLKKILTTAGQYAEVVSTLKDSLSDEVYQNDFDRFNKFYKVIWNCAENLPYPEFYQAWHHPPTTPHPEVEDNTPVTSTPFTQQCNLALLPQILNQAIQTHPLNRQPICIDGSRFSDPSNPALQIYTTLKKAGCPPSPDGKPRTIAELQAYCDDDLSDHQIALILYEEPTDPPPQGFDIAVLNQLARFSHPPIAVIVPQPLPECRLPQFLESDPDLMATLLQWLQNLDR